MVQRRSFWASPSAGAASSSTAAASKFSVRSSVGLIIWFGGFIE